MELFVGIFSLCAFVGTCLYLIVDLYNEIYNEEV